MLIPSEAVKIAPRKLSSSAMEGITAKTKSNGTMLPIVNSEVISIAALGKNKAVAADNNAAVGNKRAVITTTYPALIQPRDFSGIMLFIFCLVINIYRGRVGKINNSCEMNKRNNMFDLKKSRAPGITSKEIRRPIKPRSHKPMYKLMYETVFLVKGFHLL